MIFASGTMALHDKLEKCVANFIGKPATIVFGMGYVTNSAILPVLMGKVCFFGEWNCLCKHGLFNFFTDILIAYSFNLQGGLIISDSLNHNSIVNGARGSGATIRVFQHNSKSISASLV